MFANLSERAFLMLSNETLAKYYLIRHQKGGLLMLSPEVDCGRYVFRVLRTFPTVHYARFRIL